MHADLLEALDRVVSKRERHLELLDQFQNIDRRDPSYKGILSSIVGADFAFTTAVHELRQLILHANIGPEEKDLVTYLKEIE